MAIDCSLKEELVAKIKVDTPWLIRITQAVFLLGSQFGLVVGNIFKAQKKQE